MVEAQKFVQLGSSRSRDLKQSASGMGGRHSVLLAYYNPVVTSQVYPSSSPSSPPWCGLTSGGNTPHFWWRHEWVTLRNHATTDWFVKFTLYILFRVSETTSEHGENYVEISKSVTAWLVSSFLNPWFKTSKRVIFCLISVCFCLIRSLFLA